MPEPLPPPPPMSRRLLTFPGALAHQVQARAEDAWRRSRQRLSPRQRRTYRDPGLLVRAWRKTDQHYVVRALQGTGVGFEAPPQSQPPAPGTEARLSGRLEDPPHGLGELRLDGEALDDAFVRSLGLGPNVAPFDVEITVRVVEPPDDRAEAA